MTTSVMDSSKLVPGKARTPAGTNGRPLRSRVRDGRASANPAAGQERGLPGRAAPAERDNDAFAGALLATLVIDLAALVFLPRPAWAVPGAHAALAVLGLGLLWPARPAGKALLLAAALPLLPLALLGAGLGLAVITSWWPGKLALGGLLLLAGVGVELWLGSRQRTTLRSPQ